MVKKIDQLIGTNPVTEAAEHFIGIMNLRGQILTAVDPKYFLTPKRDATSKDQVLIILKTKLELIRLGKLSHKQTAY